MTDPIKLQTPMGEITIPFDEEKILNFYRKMVKANEKTDLLKKHLWNFLI